MKVKHVIVSVLGIIVLVIFTIIALNINSSSKFLKKNIKTAEENLDLNKYKLIFNDEFDGTELDKKNWTFDIGNSGWGNNELQYYTDRKENAKVENGNLIITAKKEEYNGANYTSARVISKDLNSVSGGVIEARMKIPLGNGIWPAFWLLGENFDDVGWPQCGEIDIMEHVNTSDEIVATAHWFDTKYTSDGGTSSGIDMNEYHVYSLEWTENDMNWYIDHKKFASIKLTEEAQKIFSRNFYIILNLAVGGNWPGNPDNSTSFPADYYIDYIRIYK